MRRCSGIAESVSAVGNFGKRDAVGLWTIGNGESKTVCPRRTKILNKDGSTEYCKTGTRLDDSAYVCTKSGGRGAMTALRSIDAHARLLHPD